MESKNLQDEINLIKVPVVTPGSRYLLAAFLILSQLSGAALLWLSIHILGKDLTYGAIILLLWLAIEIMVISIGAAVVVISIQSSLNVLMTKIEQLEKLYKPPAVHIPEQEQKIAVHIPEQEQIKT